MLETYSAKLAAPFAVMGVRTHANQLAGIDYLPLGVATLAPIDAFSREVCKQLRAYLKNPRFRFDLAYTVDGTPFQRKVWEEVKRVPCGQTLTYAGLARATDSAPRPVGMACGANDLPLLIPCHRIVASNGIGGFMHSRKGRGIDVKLWLLRHEGARV